jgi:glycerophosphoryl diester phosphodiesterase
MTQAPPLPQPYLDLPIAHRGLHDRTFMRPENSRAAVRAAAEQGYGVEIDIQSSSDGVPMVIHDPTLERLTDRAGRVDSLTAGELGTLEILGSGEPVATLAEVLTDIGGRVPLLIEIKDQDGRLGPDVGALEQAVADALAGYDGPVAVMSFNPHSVIAFGAAAPHLPRGLITCSYEGDGWKHIDAARRDHLRAIADLEASGASFISHEARDLSRPRVSEIRQSGLPILSWTIRSMDEEVKARRYADGITFEGYLPALP